MDTLWMGINRGSDITEPFLAITHMSGKCMSTMHISGVTPEKLRELASDLETILNRRAEVAFALSKAKTEQGEA